MLTKFPIRGVDELYQAADAADVTLTRDDWLEAFAAHPKARFSDDDRLFYLPSLMTAKQPIKAWEAQEQKATKDADEVVLDRFEELNDAYYNKFGYIYIVCATGKTALEMLRILESRKDNSPEDELAVAAAEQSRITKLRLVKLVQE
uniref:2-oxo-4-hydroxy-4-carboxy-5-ureidoimidazoline decarboxylase n=1 Tax=Hyaloperonospora arabidopsidis (strain Emoy2) TaxID=559515 RepID=M4B1M0_HYAAE